MGEDIVVTAFLSEGCDPCLAMKETIQVLAEKFPEIPIFVSYDETMMDYFEIEMVPTTIIASLERTSSWAFEGYQSPDDMEKYLEQLRTTGDIMDISSANSI